MKRETVIVVYLVSVRRILSSFRPIIYRQPRLNRINRFPVVDKGTEFSIFFQYFDKFWDLLSFTCRLP